MLCVADQPVYYIQVLTKTPQFRCLATDLHPCRDGRESLTATRRSTRKGLAHSVSFAPRTFRIHLLCGNRFRSATLLILVAKCAPQLRRSQLSVCSPAPRDLRTRRAVPSRPPAWRPSSIARTPREGQVASIPLPRATGQHGRSPRRAPGPCTNVVRIDAANNLAPRASPRATPCPCNGCERPPAAGGGRHAGCSGPAAAARRAAADR